MNRTKIPYLDFCWNPCGFGCSHGCPTCWARRQATGKGPTAPACPDCRAFKVHFHPERLTGKLAPAARKKPAVVGVQFLGDLFDYKRADQHALALLDACMDACQHTYVFLTRQYELQRTLCNHWYRSRIETHGRSVYDLTSRCWYMGTTCTTQQQYIKAAVLCGDTAWPWWVSAEPLERPIVPGLHARPQGVVIGADNRLTHDCGVGVIRATARAFADAGVKVYVKQMWLWQCPSCREMYEERAMGPSMRCPCGTPAADMLHTLATSPERFPADLRSRELPWTLTMGKKTVAGSQEPVASGGQQP